MSVGVSSCLAEGSCLHLLPPPREQSVAFLLDERCQFVQIVDGHLPSTFTLGLSRLLVAEHWG